MRRSALGCFQRGVLSTRANFGLVGMAVLQNLVVVVLFVVSVVPLILVIGGRDLFAGGVHDMSDVGRIDAWLGDLPKQLEGHLGALLLGVLASLLVGMLAVVVWAWFQAGLVGTLLSGERQAHPEAELRAGGWRWFKTFSLTDFAGWGGRHLWRFFWYFHVMITAWMVLALVATILLFGVGVAWQSWGGLAATGLGCGGTIPLAFLFWVLAAWSLLAQPAVALPESGAVSGSLLGFRVLGHRLGAASLLLLTVLVLSIASGLVVGMGRAIFDLVFQESWLLRLGLVVVSILGQWVVASVVNVFALAGFAALVVGDPEAGEQ